MKIAIDPGHGSNTAGKRTPPFPDGSVMCENEFNEGVAALLAVELQKQGFETIQVAPEQEDTPLPTRVDRANLAKADLYISIHANAFGDNWNSAYGIETFVHSLSDQQTVSIAKAIQGSLVTTTGRADRGVKENRSLYVLHATTMPAVLVESGFMTNLEEAKLLRSEAYRRTVARAIAKGVCDYYGKGYEASMEKEKNRYQKLTDVPAWGKALIGEMVEKGCFGDADHLDLSEDMLRVMVLWNRLEGKRKEA